MQRSWSSKVIMALRPTSAFLSLFRSTCRPSRSSISAQKRCYAASSSRQLDPDTPSQVENDETRPLKTTKTTKTTKTNRIKATVGRPSHSAIFSPEYAENLPPLGEWRKYFPSSTATQQRVSVRKPETADQIANAFVPEGSKNKVIIECFPGPGQLTRSLLRLPKERIKRLIVMEDDTNYLKYLKPLEALDPRIKVLPINGSHWSSYRMLDELSLLEDVDKQVWDAGVHHQLQFISHIPTTVSGEQLVSQLFRNIPEKQWLFQYGRVPMNFILSTYLWERITASPDSKMRCKLGVIAQTVAECKEDLPYEVTQPFATHFHPAVTFQIADRMKRVGHPFQTVTAIPLEKQLIKEGSLDAWDFCVRRLFVQKATPLGKVLPTLAPGAQTLLKAITDINRPVNERLDVKKKKPNNMSSNDWSILVNAFIDWPFAPEDLSIDTMFLSNDR
ncbi:S-adenosyl-L-methionine-dependent methyltransferase [Crucibulum laeve]|uniref:rRNA adenine N(6)-methyltransferase n=1 Tax=Crucibulum laeve TaxID=68775 RepID=A0A5C3MFP5_9AGAR|nr:S-adenosyl-L-methionine-dependent methyltransferase [Crucibulum laeve]